MSDPALQLLEYIKEAVERVESKLDGHDGRLRQVESWQSNADGKITVFGVFCAGIGGLLAWLLNLFKH